MSSSNPPWILETAPGQLAQVKKVLFHSKLAWINTLIPDDTMLDGGHSSPFNPVFKL
jgi:hypothetical protein